MALWLAEKMENVSKQVSKLVGYGGDAEPMAPAEADGFTSPQGKRNRSSESPEERKDARVDFSPASVVGCFAGVVNDVVTIGVGCFEHVRVPKCACGGVQTSIHWHHTQ